MTQRVILAAMKAAEPGGAERLIRRYENRKLYDSRDGRYVTLEDLGRMIGDGEELRVLDQKSGDDLTALVLAQVVLEGVKQRSASVPRQVLSRLIRLAWRRGAGWGDRVAPQDAAARARDEAERIVSGLLGRGRLSLEEALSLRQELAASVQRIVADAQHGVESRVRHLLERTEREDGVSPALQSLKERLLSFEAYLTSPGTPAAKPQARPARSGRGGKPGGRAARARRPRARA
jgi:polyhydroxyalkanoate synthesis repressor PhaR